MQNRGVGGRALCAISLGVFVIGIGGAAAATEVLAADRAKAAAMRKQQIEQAAKPQTPAAQHASQSGRMDTILADEVFARLVDRTSFGSKVDVNARDGSVTLAGTVPSQQAKDRAGRVARRTPGVERVRNTLLVQSPETDLTESGEIDHDDARLAENVARAIADQLPTARAGEDWWLTGWRVEGPDNDWNLIVEADRGEITLEGDVPRSSIIATAVRAARDVSGVEDVNSELQLEPAYFPYQSPYPHHAPGYGVAGPYGYAHPGYSYAYIIGPYETRETQEDYEERASRKPQQAEARQPQKQQVMARQASASAGGETTIEGRVTRVNRSNDTLIVRTIDGSTVTLPLLDDSSLARGDQVEIEVAVRERQDDEGTATP